MPPANEITGEHFTSSPITDSMISTVRFGQAWRINDKLGTGGAYQDIPWVNPIKSYQIFQADLTYKF